MLREADELGDLARAAGRPLSGEMRMSVIPTIAPFLLPRILPRLRREYPELKLFLREETSGQACEQLHHGRTDCVLLALPFACGEVEAAPLFDDRLFVAFPEGEMDPTPTIRPADIDANRLLMLEDGHCLKDHALAACNPPRAARRGDDAGHVAAHDGADGRQRAGRDDAARDGDRRGHPRAYPGDRAAARRGECVAPHRVGLAQGEPRANAISGCSPKCWRRPPDRATLGIAMTLPLRQPVREWRDVDRAADSAKRSCRSASRPLLRGVAGDWPSVAAGGDAASIAAYLRRFDLSANCDVLVGSPNKPWALLL